MTLSLFSGRSSSGRPTSATSASSPQAPDGCGCPDYLATSRRGFLKAAGVGATALGATSVIGTTVVTRAAAATRSAPWTIVVLSLRGAADGLSLVVPHADANYYAARRTIAVPKSQLLVADEQFGLHPSLRPLLDLWGEKRLAVVHAAGLKFPNRSHFSAMEEVEDAAPGSESRTGWLNRLIGADAYTSPLQGISVGQASTAMFGDAPTMAMNTADSVHVGGADSPRPSDRRMASLSAAWRDSDSQMGTGMRSTLSAVSDFSPVLDQPDRSSTYPRDELGQALESVARTIKADVGSSVFTVDHGNWDMHTDVGTVGGGWMVNQATTLAGSIKAFFDDLGPRADKVTLVTISEFGRRVKENSNRGLDHGWGNVMFLAGAGVNGGDYYARWPGLQNTDDADLQVTTDYRSVLSEVISTRTGVSSGTVFPGFTPEDVGVMRSGA